jgi:hypothetical protein
MPDKYRGLLFAALCAGALGALIFFAQSAATESAPAYSTWNSSPEGAELLFDGLKNAGFVQVSRQFKPLSVQKPRQATVFFLGVQAFALNNEDAGYFDAMEAAARFGNDVVIAVPDESTYTFQKDQKKTLLETRWGVRFASEKGIFSADPIVDKSWKVAREGVWKRAFGQGCITLVAKGQRLDNKSTAGDEASRALLYELVSEHPAAIFEEAHLGIQESGSIVGLARHYHLQGLMAGLLVLAGLFVWSRSVSFPPPRPLELKPLTGSDTRSMLTELMSRHLRNGLVAACVAEWNRTRGQTPPLSLPAEPNAVAAYAQLQQGIEDRQKFKL